MIDRSAHLSNRLLLTHNSTRCPVFTQSHAFTLRNENWKRQTDNDLGFLVSRRPLEKLSSEIQKACCADPKINGTLVFLFIAGHSYWLRFYPPVSPECSGESCWNRSRNAKKKDIKNK